MSVNLARAPERFFCLPMPKMYVAIEGASETASELREKGTRPKTMLSGARATPTPNVDRMSFKSSSMLLASLFRCHETWDTIDPISSSSSQFFHLDLPHLLRQYLAKSLEGILRILTDLNYLLWREVHQSSKSLS